MDVLCGGRRLVAPASIDSVTGDLSHCRPDCQCSLVQGEEACFVKRRLIVNASQMTAQLKCARTMYSNMLI